MRYSFWVLFVLGLSLGALELGLTWLDPIVPWPVTPGPEENVVGWGPEFIPECGSIPPHIETKQKKVVLLGDSILNCFDARDAARKPHGVIQSLLPADIGVVNIASGGWGTDQETLAYEEHGKKYGSALVLLFFTPANDLLNNILPVGLAVRRQKPFFKLDGDQLRYVPVQKQTTQSSWARWFNRTQLGLHLLVLRENLSGAIPAYDPLELYEEPDSEWVSQSWKLTQALLGRLKSAVEESGGRLALVYVPTGIDAQASGCSGKACLGYTPTKAQSLCEDRTRSLWNYTPYNRLKAIADPLALDVIDVFDKLPPLDVDYRGVVYDCTHLSSFGTSIVSQKVADYILKHFEGSSSPTKLSANFVR